MKTKHITFSRSFPAYHPKKGQQTYFVEAILTQLDIDYTDDKYFVWLVENNPKITELFLSQFFLSLSHDIESKSHTIRSHKIPLNIGDYISSYCWADRPYHKTPDGYWQIKFAPNIEIKKVWDYKYIILPKQSKWLINNVEVSVFDSYMQQWANSDIIKKIAQNDGLNLTEFCDWFNKPFSGSIICWNELINY
jgi:hypothetical protein